MLQNNCTSDIKTFPFSCLPVCKTDYLRATAPDLTMRTFARPLLALAKPAVPASRRGFTSTPSYVLSATNIESPCVWHRIFGGVLSHPLRTSVIPPGSQDRSASWGLWGVASRSVDEADDGIVAISGEVKENPTESEADVAADRTDEDPLPPGLHHTIPLPAGEAAPEPTPSEERVRADRSPEDPLPKAKRR